MSAILIKGVPDSWKDRLKELLAQQAQLARDTQKVETAWLEASEALEEQSREIG